MARGPVLTLQNEQAPRLEKHRRGVQKMVDRLGTRSHSRIQHWPILVLRLYTGLFFAWNGLGKLRRDNFADSLEGFLSAQAASTFDFYLSFVHNVVLPNKAIFAALVSWGELAIGVAMILGLATRYAAVAGVILVLNFWFAKGAGFFDGTNHDVVWLMIFIVLGAVPAGRIAGLDDGLSDQLPFLR
jgi:thiosulfate dehydrogenase [quinone] large subunit